MNTKQEKKNLLFYPLGTVGRDMVYALFTNYVMLFILYTKQLTNQQLVFITGIMVFARIFDALNDPIMGFIIEKTRSKYGKFKPWLLSGILLTSVVIYLVFNTNLEGWNFVWFFLVIYLSYSIAYTMHDISYWGMIPALSKDGDMRNKLTARATLFAGIGGIIAGICIPMFTAGSLALGGNAKTAYGRIALIIAVLAPLFILFTLFGAKEDRSEMATSSERITFRKIGSSIGGNDQLLWMILIFLLQQIGNGIVLAGAGPNYIYFEFGYEGGLYSTFSTVGMMATGFLMIFYPAISRKLHRQRMVELMWIVGTIGYAIMLVAGLFLPSTMLKFWILSVGFMAANLGQYGLYLIMMISIINTVEYNELKTGSRDEAIIASVRPFLTKMASSVTIIIATVTYMIVKVTEHTNQISGLEKLANQELITAAEKSEQIAAVISEVAPWQKNGLLLSMTVLPCALMIISCMLYKKHYILSEEKYDEICKELETRKANQ
ncbi:MAG: MFS transporter [Lachnospiraceae bacterium]|nr:MFS transporter [Lachnospiraceae bacterium]